MRLYYEQSGIQIYHGDCREYVLGAARADVVISDPPYDAETHAGARTLSKNTDGGIDKIGIIKIDFDPADVEFTAGLWRMAERWTVLFCSLEMLGEYRRLAGEAYIRGGFWHRPNGTPQISGDRPAQPGEGLALLHRPGRKRWNGGGCHGFYQHMVVNRDRVHPTQKPESLMVELVSLFSDPGETILDPFMGSGTTLVAAKRLGRKAIGIEINEAYCAAAVKRLQQATLPLDMAQSALPMELGL